MTIKCFGIARDIFDGDQLLLDDVSVETVADLRVYLNSRSGQLAQINSYLIAVNQEYAEDEQAITSTDEIAIIPPVSGG